MASADVGCCFDFERNEFFWLKRVACNIKPNCVGGVASEVGNSEYNVDGYLMR